MNVVLRFSGVLAGHKVLLYEVTSGVWHKEHSRNAGGKTTEVEALRDKMRRG